MRPSRRSLINLHEKTTLLIFWGRQHSGGPWPRGGLDGVLRANGAGSEETQVTHGCCGSCSPGAQGKIKGRCDCKSFDI